MAWSLTPPQQQLVLEKHPNPLGSQAVADFRLKYPLYARVRNTAELRALILYTSGRLDPSLIHLMPAEVTSAVTVAPTAQAALTTQGTQNATSGAMTWLSQNAIGLGNALKDTYRDIQRTINETRLNKILMRREEAQARYLEQLIARNAPQDEIIDAMRRDFNPPGLDSYDLINGAARTGGAVGGFALGGPAGAVAGYSIADAGMTAFDYGSNVYTANARDA